MLLCETVHSDRDQNKKSLHMFPQACIPVLRYTRWWNICGKGDHDSKKQDGNNNAMQSRKKGEIWITYATMALMTMLWHDMLLRRKDC